MQDYLANLSKTATQLGTTERKAVLLNGKCGSLPAWFLQSKTLRPGSEHQRQLTMPKMALGELFRACGAAALNAVAAGANQLNESIASRQMKRQLLGILDCKANQSATGTFWGQMHR